MTCSSGVQRGDRRDAILDMAQECFFADGFEATSMATIAARVGGSKGTLYNYFQSKEELFDAVVRRSCARLQSRLDPPPPDADLRSRLTQISVGFLTHVLSPEGLAIHRLVVGEGHRFPELVRLFYDIGPAALDRRIAKLLLDQMEEGILRQADPNLAAQHLKGLLLSGIVSMRVWGIIKTPAPAALSQHAGLAVGAFLRAYCSSAPCAPAR